MLYRRLIWLKKLVLLTAADIIDQKNQLREVAQCQKYSKTADEVEKKWQLLEKISVLDNVNHIWKDIIFTSETTQVRIIQSFLYPIFWIILNSRYNWTYPAVANFDAKTQGYKRIQSGVILAQPPITTNVSLSETVQQQQYIIVQAAKSIKIQLAGI